MSAGDTIRTVMTNVLDGWIEGQKSNHEALDHRGENSDRQCWENWHTEDVRHMIEDAAREADLPRPKGFVEKMADAAAERLREEGALLTAITNLILTRRSTFRVGHVVTVHRLYGVPADVVAVTGDFVVEIIERVARDTEKSMWTTLHDGRHDSWRWHTVDQALLHLIAQRHGDPDDRGEIVTFASRVIGFDDTPQEQP